MKYRNKMIFLVMFALLITGVGVYLLFPNTSYQQFEFEGNNDFIDYETQEGIFLFGGDDIDGVPPKDENPEDDLVDDFEFKKDGEDTKFNYDNKWVKIQLYDKGNKKFNNYELEFYDSNGKLEEEPTKYKNGQKYGWKLNEDLDYVKWKIHSNVELEDFGKLGVRFQDEDISRYFDGKTYIEKKWKTFDFKDLQDKNPSATINLTRKDNKQFELQCFGCTDLDPTISDTFTSDLGGNYTNTTWSFNDNAIKLEKDALLIYKFDDNESNVFDLSVNGLDINTDAPSPLFTSCQYDAPCLDFDGTNDYVRVKDHPYLNLDTNWTWSAFVYPTETDGDIISKYTSGSDYNYLIGLFGGKLRCYIYDGAVKYAESTSTITQDTWTNIVCMHNTTTITAIVDGTVEDTTHGIGTIDTTTADLVFGTEDVSEADGGVHFDGIISCVQLWNNTVSTMGINSRLTLGTTCNNSLFKEFANPPIATWNLTGYEKVQFESNSSLHGDLGVFYNETGIYGGSIELDGIDDYIDTTQQGLFDITGNTNMTFMFWMNSESIDVNAKNQNIFSVCDGSLAGDSGYFFYVEGNDLTFSYNNGSAFGQATIPYQNVLNQAQNYHLAIVINNEGSVQNNITIYIDGAGIISSVNARNGSWAKNQPFRISTLQGIDWFFNGTIDDFMVINRSLLGDEITQIYSGSKATHSYIPKYKPSGQYLSLVQDNGSDVYWKNITLYGLFDNDTLRSDIYDPDYLVSWFTGDNVTVDRVGFKSFTLNGSKYDSSGRGINGSVNFDGLDDFAHYPAYGTTFGNITICLWSHELSESATTGRLFSLRNVATNKFEMIRKNSVNAVYLKVNGANAYVVDGELSEGWDYICATYNGSGGHIYVDGNKSSTTISDQGTIKDNEVTDVFFGNQHATANVRHYGLIDEVKIWNRTLSDEDIKEEFRKSSGSKVSVQFRSSIDNKTWNSWYNNGITDLSNGLILLNGSIPHGRYGQYKLFYDGTDTELTQEITRVDVGFSNFIPEVIEDEEETAGAGSGNYMSCKMGFVLVNNTCIPKVPTEKVLDTVKDIPNKLLDFLKPVVNFLFNFGKKIGLIPENTTLNVFEEQVIDNVQKVIDNTKEAVKSMSFWYVVIGLIIVLALVHYGILPYWVIIIIPLIYLLLKHFNIL